MDDHEAFKELSESWETPAYEQPFHGATQSAYQGRMLQYLLAFALIAAALVIYQAVSEWTPGPPDDRTLWEKMEGKKR